MGIFEKRGRSDPPHPRQEPRLAGELTVERLAEVFSDCADFTRRELAVGGNEALRCELLFLAGMVKQERASDYVLRPLAQDRELGALRGDALWEKIKSGALYSLSVSERESLDAAAASLIDGECLFFLAGERRALAFSVGTEEKRGVGDPENEVAVKGARDSFVENLRTNTSLTRRHLKAPELKIREQVVGRQSLTPVDILWIEGIANPETVARVEAELAQIDIDALLSTGNVEEYLTDSTQTAFPLLLSTERPDRFCYGLCQGKVGILAEGLPLGYLAPSVMGDFLMTPQDRSENWATAAALTVLRWLCVPLTLCLPAVYVAAVRFHFEMLPTRLALSVVASRRDVPFSALFETLLLLLAFEVLQEAGLRLPQSVGQTVSILGGLVVGSAAVEARLISPAVLVVVAVAGIAGYTVPSQDLAGALRLWRLLLTALGGMLGLLGVAAGTALLIGHLAGLESFGTAYLTPFVTEAGAEGEGLIRQPLPADRFRPAHLRVKNRRKQR